jgi:hypothetical protein
VLAGLVYEQVRACVDFAKLAAIEERIAIELARLPGTSDEQMLELAQATITRALHEIADRRFRGEPSDEQALSIRYLNAICRAVDPACTAGE